MCFWVGHGSTMYAHDFVLPISYFPLLTWLSYLIWKPTSCSSNGPQLLQYLYIRRAFSRQMGPLSVYPLVFPNYLLVRKVDVLFIKQWAWCELLSTQHKAHGQHIVRNNRLNEMSACRRTDLMILSAHWLAARQALITTFVDCVMFSKMFITIAYSQSLLFTRRIRQVRMILVVVDFPHH